MKKETLRKRIRRIKSRFSEDQLVEMSIPIIDKILHHPKIIESETILFYYSLEDEVYTHTLIIYLKSIKKTILLPRITFKGLIEIAPFEDLDSLVEGRYGVMEPKSKTFRRFSKIDVALVPGIAFDSQGNRLGRGKGYYDKLLKKIPRTYKIGLGFDFQKFSHIPSSHWDVKMDEVL